MNSSVSHDTTHLLITQEKDSESLPMAQSKTKYVQFELSQHIGLSEAMKDSFKYPEMLRDKKEMFCSYFEGEGYRYSCLLLLIAKDLGWMEEDLRHNLFIKKNLMNVIEKSFHVWTPPPSFFYR